jgi:CHASE3 domain sensor protein
MNHCINCGFNSESLETFRNHSCIVSSWKEALEIRLAAREAAAEIRRDKAEEAIAAIVGRDLDSSTFYQIRSLFSEWESAEEEMSKATERLNSL